MVVERWLQKVVVEGNCLFVDVVYLLFSANATHAALI